MKILLSARNGTLRIIALMAVITLLSCNNRQREEPKEEVRVEITTPDGTRDFTVYTYEQKDEAVREANNELDKLNSRIDEWKAEANAKSDELSAEAKAEYEQAIADLEKTRDDYQAEVDKLQNSTQENWEQAREDIGRKYDNVKKEIERGWENFKEDVDRSVQEAEESLQ